jgi:hypothetical protein
MVRNDLLVAPALFPESKRQTRKLYLPYPDKWYPMNLRPDDPIGVALPAAADGGSRIEYSCLISDQDPQLPYITPMYIREGKPSMSKLWRQLLTRIRSHHSQDPGQRLHSRPVSHSTTGQSDYFAYLPREEQCRFKLKIP